MQVTHSVIKEKESYCTFKIFIHETKLASSANLHSAAVFFSFLGDDVFCPMMKFFFKNLMKIKNHFNNGMNYER